MFYNPYSPYPDFGQGFSDITSNLLQMYLINKFFPKKDKDETEKWYTLGETPLAPGRDIPMPGEGQQGATGQTPVGQGLDPELIQRLMQLIGGR